MQTDNRKPVTALLREPPPRKDNLPGSKPPAGGLYQSGEKGYTNSYANTVFRVLNVMLSFATERELIPENPCGKVKKLKNRKKQIEILTVEEVQRLFPEDWGPVWGDNRIAYTINRLASLTGMRSGELMGLRGEYVFDDYIYVCGSYGEYGYGPTKSREVRFIPLMTEMTGLLKSLKEYNGNGYVFSKDGGTTPVSRRYFYYACQQALKRIGTGEEEIRRRGLSLHGWRHFFNTEL